MLCPQVSQALSACTFRRLQAPLFRSPSVTEQWCPGPDLNRHGRNGRGILSSLHYGTTRDNPPKQKSFAPLLSLIPSRCSYFDLRVSAQCQRDTPPGGANCRCDSDDNRPAVCVYFSEWLCTIKPSRELLNRPPKHDETINFSEFTFSLVFG